MTHTCSSVRSIYQVLYLYTALLFSPLLSAIYAQTNSTPLKPDILGNKSFTEVYTLTAHGDDSTFIQVLFTITNLGIEDKNAACTALIFQQAKKAWKANEKFTPKQWTYSPAPNPTLAIGSSALTVLPDRLNLRAAVGGARIDIVLHAAFAPAKPPNTDFPKSASGKFRDFDILVPWSAAQGTVALPGAAPQSISGFGTLDRARSVGTTRDICRSWVTFRGHSGQEYFLADFRLPPQKDAPAVGWIWRTADTGPVAVQGLDIRKEPLIVDGRKSERCMISALDGTFTIAGREVLYRYSFVDELGTVTGGLVKLVVGKPITAYCPATARFNGGTRPVPGILELMTIE
ncbi:MAG TPA: hypothetical protein VKF42_10875 [Chitinivibrionales bacterium]|jgi:hypothetical protein|nr:hypothetical protein [Chitinivibrionales bacterium]